MFNFYEPMMGGHFEATYRAFPLAFIDKQSAEYGDKVILPPSALDRLGEPRQGRHRCVGATAARCIHAAGRMQAVRSQLLQGRFLWEVCYKHHSS
jgi:hypothetical protein